MITITGSMGDLPEDLFGKHKPDLNLGANGSGSKELDQLLSKEPASNFNLVPNDASLRQLHDDSLFTMQTKEQGRNNAIKVARLMATLGKGSLEISQYLSQKMSAEDIASSPILLQLIGAPFLWRIVDDTLAFDSCDTAARELRKLNRKSLYVLESNCSGCTFNCQGTCLKLSKTIIHDFDFTPEAFQQINGTLKMMGYNLSQKTASTIDDIREILSGKETNETKTYFAPPKVSKPAMSMEKALNLLHAQSLRKENEQVAYDKSHIASNQARPISQLILGLLYKDFGKDEIKRQVEASFFTPDTPALFEKIFNALNDPLVLAKQLIPPVIFSNCDQARVFLAKSRIKPKFIKEIDQCKGCHNRDGSACGLLGGTILGRDAKVPLSDRQLYIDNFLTENRISADQARQCKELEKTRYLAGLDAAFRLAHSKQKIESGSFLSPVNLSVQQTKDVEPMKSDLRQAAAARLSSGVAFSSVKASLRMNLPTNQADEVAEECLFGLQTVNADVIDDCLTAKHTFRESSQLIKTSKCSRCDHANDFGCSRTMLPFMGTPSLNFAEETLEAKEILSFFDDTDGRIEIKADSNQKGLDIDLQTDSGAVYDLGKPDHSDLPDLTPLDMLIQLNPNSSSADPLDISGLGEDWELPDSVA